MNTSTECTNKVSRKEDNEAALGLVEELSSELEQAYAKILELEEQLKQRGVKDA